MKIEALKNEISLSDKWSSIRNKNEYCFSYLEIQILIKDRSSDFKVSILLEDGYISEEKESLQGVYLFLKNNLDIDL